MAGEGRLSKLEDRYEGYPVYDIAGEKIGKVDGLFVDEAGREEYVGVKMGLFGTGGTALIPSEVARVNERDGTVEVAESRDRVKEAPSLDDDEDVTREREDEVRRHFGLEPVGSASGGGEEPGGEGASYDRRTRTRRRTVREEILEEEETEEERS